MRLAGLTVKKCGPRSRKRQLWSFFWKKTWPWRIRVNLRKEKNKRGEMITRITDAPELH